MKTLSIIIAIIFSVLTLGDLISTYALMGKWLEEANGISKWLIEHHLFIFVKLLIMAITIVGLLALPKASRSLQVTTIVLVSLASIVLVIAINNNVSMLKSINNLIQKLDELGIEH